MYLVIGGLIDSVPNMLDTTETFDPMVGSWVTSDAKLPQPMQGMKAASINNRLLIFGIIDNHKSTF